MSTAAVVGAGIAGRLLALELLERGWKVSLFDKGNPFGNQACSFAAAGMIAPYCELETAEESVCRLGEESLALWPGILERLDSPVFFQHMGTLCVAHSGEEGEWQRLRDRAERLRPACFETLTREPLQRLEPELAARFSQALYFPNEGQIDNRQLLAALAATLKRRGAQLHFGEKREPVRGLAGADWVIDCRGLGASLPDLRGVRGELFLIEAPEVLLSRPVRLMHPQYPLYVVPRPAGRFVVGATLIESEDYTAISVRSTLELMSAAFSLHPGFAEGRIVDSVVHCRPAFRDNLPRLEGEDGLLRLNGLYRHGFMVSPALVQQAADRMENAA